MGEILDDFVTGSFTFEQLSEKYDTEVDLIYDAVITSQFPENYSAKYDGMLFWLFVLQALVTEMFRYVSQIS